MNAIRAFPATWSNRIRALSSRLGRVPALVYVLGYLIVILAFSLIYFFYSFLGNNFGNNFSQSISQSVSGPLDDEASILRALRTEIIQAYRTNGQANQVVNGWRMITDDLQVAYLHTSLPLAFDFELVVPLRKTTEGDSGPEAFLAETVMVYLDGSYTLNDIIYLSFIPENISASPVEGVPTAIPGPGTQYGSVLSKVPGQISPPAVEPGVVQGAVLPLSLDLYNRILAYGGAFQGLPRRSAGYLGMLYFSAGVATFHASGEVVPVSALAILSVISETILAVLLISLFLNSLVYDVGEALRGTQKAHRKTDGTVPEAARKRPTKRSAKGSQPAASKEGSGNRINSWVKVIAGMLALGICVIVVVAVALFRKLAEAVPPPNSLSVAVVLPTVTWTPSPTPVPPTSTQLSASLPNAATPMYIDMPRIERNLLQNGGFEDGLSSWTYSNAVAGIHVFETSGVDGKAYCSHRYMDYDANLQKQIPAFVQELPIDPAGSYFYSGWVKLNKGIQIHASMQWSARFSEVGWAATTFVSGILPQVETPNGWVFIHGVLPPFANRANRAVFGIWHDPPYGARGPVDGTICVDDLVFGKVVK
jgi:hypothetical protein